ncbi:MAG: hypothetical protein IJG80_09665 [Selenomonadaceae bacterium]|nr:hypothetical protein [Selenomonadaceae bacterium]
MLNMIHQQSALKSLNVNRTGVAGLKVSTLKLGTTAKTSNVLGLIRGDSAPATNIKVDFTLAKSNNTPATDTATTATDYTPATGDDTTTLNVTPKQIINSGVLNSGNAAQEQVNQTLSLLDGTNTTTNINLPSTLAEKSQKLNDLANGDGNWGGNYQSDLLNDKDSDTFTGTTSSPRMDLDSITQPSSAGAMTEFQTEMNKQSEQPAWLASAKAMQEQANQQPQGVLQLLQ